MPEAKSALSVGEIVAGSYKVLGMAGAGGMGVVYRALDLKLERTVALKFLPPELIAGQTERARFLREARTASSLDHPNIGVVHGIEETPDGGTFIVMAFYEGHSLAERIRNGPLGCGQAVDIAIQMAKGLAEAHTCHIVHLPSQLRLRFCGRTLYIGCTQPGDGAEGSQPGAKPGKNDIDGISGVADHGKGGEQIPHAAPACCDGSTARGDRRGEEYVNRVCGGGGRDHSQRNERIWRLDHGTFPSDRCCKTWWMTNNRIMPTGSRI
jgi:hypothetical protein